MSKYAEFQQQFLESGETHQTLAEQCFDAIDNLTRQMIEFSGWYADDVEFISLNQASSRPKTVLRYKRSGRNRDRIREAAVQSDTGWNVGIRFRLRPDVGVAFSPREAIFVLPLQVSSDAAGNITLRIASDSTNDSVDDLERLIELTFQRIRHILATGVQSLIGKSHRPDDLLDFGFGLDSNSLSELKLEPSQTPAYPGLNSAVDHQPEPIKAPVEIASQQSGRQPQAKAIQSSEPTTTEKISPPPAKSTEKSGASARRTSTKSRKPPQ